MKKLLSLIFSFAFVIALVVACDSKPSSTEASNETAEAVEEVEAVADEEAASEEDAEAAEGEEAEEQAAE